MTLRGSPGGIVTRGAQEPDSARSVLIRAAGPALQARFGLPGVLAQPRLQLFRGDGSAVGGSGSWFAQSDRDEIRDAARRVGAFAFDEESRDAAMLVTLLPGAYTAQVSGENGSTGLALVEVYDLP